MNLVKIYILWKFPLLYNRGFKFVNGELENILRFRSVL